MGAKKVLGPVRLLVTGIAALSFSLWMSCSSGGGGGAGDANITVSPNEISLEPGVAEYVVVDVVDLPAGEGFTAYTINLSESASGIAIETGSCDPDSGSGYCETWTITSSADTVPGLYEVRISAVNPSISIATSTLTIAHQPSGGQTDTHPAVSIAAGGNHSLAVLSDKSVWSWGYANHGQLGNGLAYNAFLPVQCSSFNNAASVAAGGSHSIVLLEDDSLYTWGANESGELGNGGNMDKAEPQLILSLANVESISGSLGDSQGAHTMVLLEDGTVWAWGENGYFRLGADTNVDSNVPVQVEDISNAQALAAGGDFSLVLLSDGTVWAWGANDSGQLGNGTEVNSSSPVQVVNLNNVTAIAAGATHCLALLSDKTVWAWGNNLGTLGDGTYQKSSIPVQVQNLLNATAIAAGGAHSLALLEDKSVWAWGSNELNQLGVGNPGGTTVAVTSVPMQVASLTGVKAIAAGSNHSLALLENCDGGGTVMAWGHDAYGQLGNGPDGTSSVPVMVKGIGASGDCADDSDGDGISDSIDNCPAAANFDQADSDADMVGDACDVCDGFDDNADQDGDGLPDDCDNCPEDLNFSQADSDNDTVGDVCDSCPNDRDKSEPETCGCGIEDTDLDGNSIIDCTECAYVEGIWLILVTNISSSCGTGTDWNSTIQLQQRGCVLESTGIKGSSFVVSGSASGDTIVIGPGSYPEDGGYTTSTFFLTKSTDTTLSGTESWSWLGPDTPCNAGSANVTASKID